MSALKLEPDYSFDGHSALVFPFYLYVSQLCLVLVSSFLFVHYYHFPPLSLLSPLGRPLYLSSHVLPSQFLSVSFQSVTYFAVLLNEITFLALSLNRHSSICHYSLQMSTFSLYMC